MVSYFVSLGCDVKAFECKALRCACREGFTKIVLVLLDAGADPGVRNGECMILACRRGIPASVTIYQLADFRAILGNLDIVRILLGVNLDPKLGLLPAILGSHSETVRLLVASGAKPGAEHEVAIGSLSKYKKREMGFL